MKFSTILVLFGFAAFAIAADSTSTSTSAAPSASLTPQQLCLNACKVGDVDCQATCVGVPSPNSTAVNATTECVAGCPQGDGSAAAIKDYTNCVTGCISSNFYTTTKTGAPESTTAASGSTATGSAASASGTNAGSSQSTGTGTSGSSASVTGSGASASSTANSAPILVTGGSILGLFAIVAGIFVL